MTAPSSAAKKNSVDSSLVADDQAELVRRYAEAFVDAAVHEGQAETALDHLTAIDNELLEEYPRFKQLLASTQVPSAEKDRILVDVLGDRVSGLVLRFLRVLN